MGLFFSAGGIGVVPLSLAAGPLRKRFTFGVVALGALMLDGLLTIVLAFVPSYAAAVLLFATQASLARPAPSGAPVHSRHPERGTMPTWTRLESQRSSGGGRTSRSGPPRRDLPAEPGGEWAELVANTTRRLCLAPVRAGDVAAALTELVGAVPSDPSTWTAPDRDVVTIWWDA